MKRLALLLAACLLSGVGNAAAEADELARDRLERAGFSANAVQALVTLGLDPTEVTEAIVLRRLGRRESTLIEWFTDRVARRPEGAATGEPSIPTIEPPPEGPKSLDFKSIVPLDEVKLVDIDELAIDGSTNVTATAWSPDDAWIYIMSGDTLEGERRNHYLVAHDGSALVRLPEAPEWAEEILEAQANRRSPDGGHEAYIKVTYPGGGWDGSLAGLVSWGMNKGSKALPTLNFHLDRKQLAKRQFPGKKHYIESDEEKLLKPWRKSYLPYALFYAWSDRYPYLALVHDAKKEEKKNQAKLMIVDPDKRKMRAVTRDGADEISAPSWAHHSPRLAFVVKDETKWLGKAKRWEVAVVELGVSGKGAGSGVDPEWVLSKKDAKRRQKEAAAQDRREMKQDAADRRAAREAASLAAASVDRPSPAPTRLSKKERKRQAKQEQRRSKEEARLAKRARQSGSAEAKVKSAKNEPSAAQPPGLTKKERKRLAKEQKRQERETRRQAKEQERQEAQEAKQAPRVAEASTPTPEPARVASGIAAGDRRASPGSVADAPDPTPPAPEPERAVARHLEVAPAAPPARTAGREKNEPPESSSVSAGPAPSFEPSRSGDEESWAPPEEAAPAEAELSVRHEAGTPEREFGSPPMTEGADEPVPASEDRPPAAEEPPAVRVADAKTGEERAPAPSPSAEAKEAADAPSHEARNDESSESEVTSSDEDSPSVQAARRRIAEAKAKAEEARRRAEEARRRAEEARRRAEEARARLEALRSEP